MSGPIVVDPLCFGIRARGGVARVWSTLIPALVDAGVHVEYTGQPGIALNSRLVDESIRAAEVRERIPAPLRRFVPYRRRDGIFFPSWLRPCARGIPNVQLVHDCIKELYYAPVKAGLVRERRRRIYARAERIVAISEVTRIDLHLLYGERVGERVHVIPNPVDFAALATAVADAGGEATAMALLGRAGGRPVATYIGHRGRAKNFGEVRTLLAALPDHCLIAFGDPPAPAEVALAQSLGGRIVFAGPAPDAVMFKVLARSAFLFFPSLFEGFGLPMVESLFLGTPVLGIDTQINREVSGGLVVPFEMGSTASIRGAIGRLRRLPADDPRLHALRDRYQPARIAALYRGVFDAIAPQPAPAATCSASST